MLKSATPINLEHRISPGLVRRLAAMLYDWLLLFALMLVATSLITLPLGMPSGFGLVMFQSLLFILMPAIFFIGFWMRGGQTLGMRSWRIKLVTDSGGPVTAQAALRRLLAALLSLLPGGLGFVWMVWDPDRLAWHDRLSGTRLVMVKPRSR
jgi:uncharacterized RDD family membrane protein YckC